MPADEPSARLVALIRSDPAQLSSFLSHHATYLFDHAAVLATVVAHLSSLSCSALWQLHTRHIARLEAVVQLCPPHSPAAAAFAQLLLSDEREGADRMTVAFCGAPFSSLILALLRLSTQPASAFPLYSLAPSSASSLLSAVFFCSQPQSQAVRQHIAVLLFLVRPPPLRQRLLSSLLLQCLSCPSSSSPSSHVGLSSMDLSSVLSFLCQRMSASALLSAYTAALTQAAGSSSSAAPLSLASHRTLLNLLIGPRHFSTAIGRQLFDCLESTLSAAIAQRHLTLLSLTLQLARHSISCLHANGAAAAAAAAGARDAAVTGDWQLPRDYSAWFDEQFAWVAETDENSLAERANTDGGRAGTKRKRKEKFVLRNKEGDSLDELDGDCAEESVEAAAHDAGPTDSAVARRQQRLQQDKRRKERQQQSEEAAQADKRRLLRQQEAALEKQERVSFVLSCLFDSLADDETAVVTHYLHVVDRYWRGDGLLSEPEADRFSRCARIRIGGGSWTEGDAIVLDSSQ